MKGCIFTVLFKNQDFLFGDCSIALHNADRRFNLMMMKRKMIIIQNIYSREILDSRGIPTVEADVILSDGICGRAAVPSGASTGSYEAIERRDNDPTRFHGKGVLNAVQDIQKIIAPALLNQDAENQVEIDAIMRHLDGTDNKSKLGANAILAVSLALARAVSNAKKIPLYQYLGTGNMLPMPLVNVLNGGAHADNSIDIQEFMLVPTSASSFSEAIRMCSEVFQSLKSILKKKGLNTNVGDEGGVAPNLRSSEEAFDYLIQAIEAANYHVKKDFHFAVDVAASELFHNGTYSIDNKQLTSDQMIEYYHHLVTTYPIISIEDGLGEDDWEGWRALTQTLGSKIQLVGDDLFVTNPTRLARGIEEKAGNAILIKLNQIGSLTETLEVIKMAQTQKWNTIISHRSGETEDPFIADLSVAINAGQIKTGSISRSERLAKYNQLIRIEEALGEHAQFSKFGKN